MRASSTTSIRPATSRRSIRRPSTSPANSRKATSARKVEAGDQVTSRIVATQFAFQPQCIVVPANRTVTLRFATPDVIHGILVTGTNVNTMIIPGYVSQVHTVFTKTGDLLMPCHEFCGLGHSQMWATVRVVPEDEFKPGPDGRATCDAR